MKTQLKALMILIIALTMNQTIKADEKPEVSITIQPGSEEAAKLPEEEYLSELLEGWEKSKNIKIKKNFKDYFTRPFYKIPTRKARECIEELKIQTKDLIFALVLDNKSFKCTIENPKLVAYGPEKNARALLLKMACDKLESAEEVDKLEIKCEKYVPAKPYLEVTK